jgi:hypothetical protein
MKHGATEDEIADVLGLLQGITTHYSSCRSDATASRPEVKWDGA